MTEQKKFIVECTEIMTYKFSVMAENEDKASDIAHDILLGNENINGALKCVLPDTTTHEINWIDRSWEITEAPENDNSIPTDIETINNLNTEPIDAGLLITIDNAKNRLYENIPEDIYDEEDENPNCVDEYVNDVIRYMQKDDKFKKALAANLWDGDYVSSIIMDVVDNTFHDIVDEYEQTRNK